MPDQPTFDEQMESLRKGFEQIAIDFGKRLESLRDNPIIAALIAQREWERQEEIRREKAKKRYERRVAGRKRRKKGKR